MALDFSKAFLYGDLSREAYIELPPEDARGQKGDAVGFLRKSMYGLRDAPQVWQSVVTAMLEERGYKPLVGTQCSYVNMAEDTHIVAHVEDFLVLGSHDQLLSLLGVLQAAGFECSGQILGDDEGEVSQIKFLGRTISLVEGGCLWEGDSRHVGSFFVSVAAGFVWNSCW